MCYFPSRMYEPSSQVIKLRRWNHKTQVFNQLKKLYLTCGKCGEKNGPFEYKNDNENLFQNRMCSNPECQSKYPFEVDTEATIHENYQRVTLQEPPGTVLAGRMPRSKDAVLTGIKPSIFTIVNAFLGGTMPGRIMQPTLHCCWRCHPISMKVNLWILSSQVTW